jgi:tRNA-binding EMAP/Myf-like protein
LYVEEVDCGEENLRIVVSGLVKYISQEDFLGKKVILLCNLKPAKMRGIESQAMVLCATSQDGLTVELVEPPVSSKPGDLASFDGFAGPPEKQLNSKKKTWENIQPLLRTDKNRQATFISEDKTCFLRTVDGICSVKTVVGGLIK